MPRSPRRAARPSSHGRSAVSTWAGTPATSGARCATTGPPSRPPTSPWWGTAVFAADDGHTHVHEHDGVLL